MKRELADRGLELLFDAVTRRGSWSEGLGQLAAAFGANGAALIPENPMISELGLPVFGSAADAFPNFIEQGWYQNDLRAQRGWQLASKGQRVFYEHHVSTEEERRTEPYYQDFFWKYDMPWFVGVSFSAVGQRWAFALFRSTEDEPFQPDMSAALLYLRPHFSRIVKLAYALRANDHTGTLSILERAGVPLVGIGFDERVAWSTAQARSVLLPEVTIRQGRLQTQSRLINERLAALVHQASRVRSPLGQNADSAVLISDGIRPRLLIDILAMPRSGQDVFSHLAAIATIRVLSGPIAADPTRLVKLFGLTPMEAQVAALVGSGLSNPAAAKRLDLGYETVKTHLARVYQKLGITRQSELSSLVSALQ